jgi:hypothetical protein
MQRFAVYRAHSRMHPRNKPGDYNGMITINEKDKP